MSKKIKRIETRSCSPDVPLKDINSQNHETTSILSRNYSATARINYPSTPNTARPQRVRLASHLLTTSNAQSSCAKEDGKYMNTKTAQARYKIHDNMHGRFEPRFAIGNYIMFEYLALNASTANYLASEWYSKLLPRRTEPYQHMKVGSQYAQITQDSIWSTTLINRLTRLGKKAERECHVRPEEKHEHQPFAEGINRWDEESLRRRERLRAPKSMYGNLLYCSLVWWRTQDDTFKLAEHTSHHLQNLFWWGIQNRQHKPKSTGRKKKTNKNKVVSKKGEQTEAPKSATSTALRRSPKLSRCEPLAK